MRLLHLLTGSFQKPWVATEDIVIYGETIFHVRSKLFSLLCLLPQNWWEKKFCQDNLFFFFPQGNHFLFVNLSVKKKKKNTGQRYKFHLVSHIVKIVVLKKNITLFPSSLWNWELTNLRKLSWWNFFPHQVIKSAEKNNLDQTWITRKKMSSFAPLGSRSLPGHLILTP